MSASVEIIQGDCRHVLATLPASSAHCCVTSPPYWGLRDYGCDGQIGLEASVALYVQQIVEVFREVWRVLRDDATCWINLGDCYASSGGAGWQGKHGARAHRTHTQRNLKRRSALGSLKPKDLMGVPWRVAFALQADGWYLRSDIIWHKPNPMPESVTDRPTKSHEYLFLFAKSERYYYDAEAIKEPSSPDSHARYARQNGAIFRARPGGVNPKADHDGANGSKQNASFSKAVRDLVPDRNKRSVWSVNTAAFPEAHFATYPPDLIKPCIMAGCPVGGTVLDPFGGSGTTGMVALELGRNAILIELNPEYVKLAKDRCSVTPGLQLA